MLTKELDRVLPKSTSSYSGEDGLMSEKYKENSNAQE